MYIFHQGNHYLPLMRLSYLTWWGIDMQFIHESHNSPELFTQFFTVGNDLGNSSVFPLDAPKFPVNDDHVAFADQGVPTLDLIIKFWDTSNGWAFHHTHNDTLDNISQASLEITGKTALSFLFNILGPNSSTTDGIFTPGSTFREKEIYFVLGGIVLVGAGVYFMNRSRLKRRKLEQTKKFETKL